MLFSSTEKELSEEFCKSQPTKEPESQSSAAETTSLDYKIQSGKKTATIDEGGMTSTDLFVQGSSTPKGL